MELLKHLFRDGRRAIRVTAMTVILMLLVTAVAAAGTFVWNLTTYGTWSDELNWTLNPPLCYVDCFPQTTNDDASIVKPGSTLILDGDYTIDDLTFNNVSYGNYMKSTNGNPPRELSCESIVIYGGTPSDRSEIYVYDNVTVIARRGGS